MRCAEILVCLLCYAPGFASSLGAEIRTRTETIRSGEHAFTIDVGGTIDPENVEITIENSGETAVRNPRITVNGKYNWYTVEGLVGEITAGRATAEEKVMAIFDFVASQSYWWSFPKERTRLNPVRHFNVYGYHICSDSACQLVGLSRAIGLKGRIVHIRHHSVAEIEWDGAWHHLDADIGFWHLKDDNRTIASMEELAAHPEWAARTYKPYRWVVPSGQSRRNIYKPDAEHAGKGLADLYFNKSDWIVDENYDRWIDEPHTMNLTLRPDEKLVRWWLPTLHKYYDQAKTHEPPRYANGQLIFEPDFSKRSYEGLISHRNIEFQANDGHGPAVHVARLQDPLRDRASTLTIGMSSPYVIVGGHIDTTFYKGGTSGLDGVSLAADLDPVQHQSTLLWNYYQWAYGLGHARAQLDPKLVKDGPTASYQIAATYTISANKASVSGARYPLIYGGQSGLDRVKVVADLQLNPNSLPALSLGRNVIRYTDETPGGHEVKVTYKWRERAGQHVPQAPESAVSPHDGEQGVAPAPRLAWSPATDPDGDSIVNYRVQVSLRPDCAWPVVATLDRDVRQGTEFQVPAGWLNPATAYYWRVRAEDANGNISPWSRIFRFKTR
ncbi:MAG: hypothetical protein HY820_05230 [Acidobacteria bacterium]|nr:hypothetical protein [Acidobacteriota bacterium]